MLTFKSAKHMLKLLILCGHGNQIPNVKIPCMNELRHEISNNVVCATNKASDQPASAV